MSILNHSIPPNGQPVFPPKGSGTQDVCQYLPVPQSWNGAHSMKSFLPNSLRKTSLISASGDLGQGESVCRVPDVGPKKERFQNGTLEGSVYGMSNLSHLLSNEVAHDKICTATMAHNVESEPLALHFLCPLSEKEKFSRIKDDTGETDHYLSSDQNIVLSVAVSSATNLDARQIDLIGRKLQRLTGFRNLRLENIIDPSLIAGFIISYDNDGSHVIDLSVKGQLAALAAQAESWDQRIANNGQNCSFPNSMKC